MKITWFGQACFEIVTSDGFVLICDPYHPAVGYPPHPRRADLVTISHGHHDHDWLGWVEGDPTVLSMPGDYLSCPVMAKGISSFHDGEGGAKRGSNTIFVLDIDGFRVCHLGDLGHLLTGEQRQAIGRIDVLMIPVGGFYTIDAVQAVEVARSLNPKLVLPMHYNTGVRETPLATVDAFSEAMGAESAHDSSIVIESLDHNGIRTIILDYLK
jgi:L-ascorbate metabolism protein UlaG (beta-lactamase superfamily)